MDRLTRTLSGGLGTALGALLMVGAISFGASVVGPMTSGDLHRGAGTAQADGSQAADANADEPPATEPEATEREATEPEATEPEATDGGADASPDATPAEEPKDEPDPTPAEEPKDEPDPTPAEEPKPSADLSLDAFVMEGRIGVKWTAYTGDFEYYKLVRSADPTATWPLGEGDQLVAVVGPDGATKFADGEAPCGHEWHYRVFAVRHDGEGYQVLADSNLDAAFVECTDSPPEPKSLGLDVTQGPDGVSLHWSSCASDAFAAYKVVRSATNENPMYPLNDGTQLIGVVSDQGATSWGDSDVASGQTWTYRVLCMGNNGDGWYVIGLSAAVTVTVE